MGTPTCVAVQGLGFVGAAMAVAVASALDSAGRPRFEVVGVDLPDRAGTARVEALASGTFPFPTTDARLDAAVDRVHRQGNLRCVTDASSFAEADVVVVDVPFDIDWRSETPELRTEGFRSAIATVGRHVRPSTLILIETTVPPGTTEKIVLPTLRRELLGRDLDADSVLVAHSYERVMPGADYFASITNYWRVYAGTTEGAADAAEEFLSAVIDTDRFPLTRLAGTTASETAKVLENTFRATTIALMEEWSRFAELVGIDLFDVVEAIRMRPTHANIRTPGFGVGGYCLTKDPLFAPLAARELWNSELDFAFSTAAVRTNDRAPLNALDRLMDLLGGSVAGRRIALLGISYRQDVGDTRYSPSETFARAAEALGATLVLHDPLLTHWDELARDTEQDVPDPADVDAVVFAVPTRCVPRARPGRVARRRAPRRARCVRRPVSRPAFTARGARRACGISRAGNAADHRQPTDGGPDVTDRAAEDAEGRRALITGGAGFIGGHLARDDWSQPAMAWT